MLSTMIVLCTTGEMGIDEFAGFSYFPLRLFVAAVMFFNISGGCCARASSNGKSTCTSMGLSCYLCGSFLRQSETRPAFSAIIPEVHTAESEQGSNNCDGRWLGNYVL